MVVSCEIALLTPWWTKEKQKLFALTLFFLKFHQQVELLSKTYQAIIVLSVFLKTYKQYFIELRQEQGSDQVELMPTFWKNVMARKE